MTEKQKLREFLRNHRACDEGAKWALENCESLAQVWTDAKPEWLIWVATREGAPARAMPLDGFRWRAA